MSYDFFAFLFRMKNIKRWSLMYCAENENVMEHTAETAFVAHALACIKNKLYGGNVNVEKVVLYALYHETGETLTGDLPTPVKYYNGDISSAYKNIERAACDKILNSLPAELQGEFDDFVLHDEKSEEYKVVKRADRLCAYVKCLSELKRGNGEFEKAKITIENQLKADGAPETEYFIENFVQSFLKTLDELNI